MIHRRLVARLALLAGLVVSPHALAIGETAGTVSVFAEAEYFKWEEFQPKNVQVLEETGPRGAIGIAWSNLRTPSGGPVYRAYAKLYGGYVDYDGQTNSTPPVPVKTETHYLGIQAEGVGGYRFGGRVGWELVSGIGFDTWLRDLQDSTDILGNPVGGYNEFYAVLNAKLGVGLFTRFDYFGFAMRAGPKLPLVAWERVHLYDGMDLMPKPSLSWFGTAEFTFGGRGKDNVTLSVYYDSYRFKESDPELLTFDGYPIDYYVQPDSDMTVYGVRLAVGF